MKRKIPILLATVLMIFAASACSKTENTQSEAVSEVQRTEELQEDRQNEEMNDEMRESKNMESEDGAKDKESKEKKILNLFYTEALMSKLVWAQPSAVTKAEAENWLDVLQFSPSQVGTIVAYEAGGQYKVLKARVAPEKDWEDDDIARIIVYGDGDVVLYESPDITKDTKAFDMEADISGLQAVSIKAVSIEGGSGHIILKDAVFE